MKFHISIRGLTRQDRDKGDQVLTWFNAMASDDEGFTLSVTSKLREFTALGYPSHVLNGAIGRAFARTRDEWLLRARLCSQRWEANL